MSFCRIAPHYDRLERLTANRRLDEARTALVDGLPADGKILSVGEGHGRFAEICLRARPDAQLTCLDASAAMLRQARQRLGATSADVDWVHADIRAWEAAESYDAIVTCFFLDCFPRNELMDVIGRLAKSARAKASWLNVDFAIPNRGPWRWRAQAVHFLMYRFFRVVTKLPARKMTSPNGLLRAQGFEPAAHREFDHGLIVAELWNRT